ncbi:MAG: alpha/beta hydrolase [Pseudonocardiales bacterium]|nr:alpha/beta hydrolase [Pseudonocardiales bacterium]
METADGERLHGWWVAADRPRSRGHVLFFHGNAGNIGDRVPLARLLASTGFDVMLFDYRGYGRSTGRPGERGTYLDADAARQAMVGLAQCDPARIIYLGESLGAAVAAELALRWPPRGLILQSAFTSLRDVARRHYPLPRSLIPDAYPTIRRIGRLEMPVLVLHGDRDRIVPLSQGRKLFEAAREPKQLHVFSGLGHNDLLCAGPHYGQVIAQWIGQLDR